MAEDDAKDALPRLAVEAEAKDLAATSCVAFEEEKDTSLPVKVIVFAQSRSEQCDADGPAASMKSSAGKQKLNKASAATAKTSMAKARAKPSWAVRRNHILHHNRLQELGLESGDNNEDVGAAVNCVICQAAKEPPYTIKEDADNAMDRVCPTNANKAFASHNHEDSRQEDGDKDREEGEQESRQEAIWTARDGTQQDPNASPASNFRGPETSLRTRLVPSESRDSQSTISTDASSLEPEVVDETAEEEPLLLVGEIGRREETYEWLATNLFQFFKEVCLMYDMCSEELEERFAEIGQGFPPHYEYRWAAPLGAPKRKPVRMSGPEYVQHVLGWVEATMNNRLYFPVDENVLFPDDFLDIVQKVYTRIFRVYAILFHHCLQILHEQDAEDFLHKSFRHFMFLVLEYNLVRDREFKAMRAAVDQVKEAYEASLQRPSAHLVDLGHVITAPIDPQVVAILASVTASVSASLVDSMGSAAHEARGNTANNTPASMASSAIAIPPPMAPAAPPPSASKAPSAPLVPPPVPAREKGRMSRLKRTISKKRDRSTGESNLNDAANSIDGGHFLTRTEYPATVVGEGSRNSLETTNRLETAKPSSRSPFTRALSSSSASLADRSSNLVQLSKKTHSASAIGDAPPGRRTRPGEQGEDCESGLGTRAARGPVSGTPSTSSSVWRWLLHR